MFKFAVLAVSTSCLALSASAQGLFENTGLGTIDPWGVGTLSRAEGALPNTLWSQSDSEILSQLMARTEVQSLSPAMRDLVRRVLLSSARRPEGDEDNKLLLQRLELIGELGETRTYSEFLRQSPGLEGVMSPFELDLDYAFARGNLASACATVKASSQTTVYILNARAVCLALEGDIDSAELALEFARGQGEQDIWFVTTIGSLEAKEGAARPAAKYETGLQLALSLGAELVIPASGFQDIPPAIASELIKRADIPRHLRIQAADIAARAGVLSPEDYRDAYRTEQVRVRAIVPTLDGGAVVIPEDDAPTEDVNRPVNPLDEALQSLGNGEISVVDRAKLFDRALALAQSDPARFRAVAGLLVPDIRRMRSVEVYQTFGERFAVAAAVSGDFRLSSQIMNVAREEGAPEPDAFVGAWLDGVQILTGADRSPQSVIVVSQRLVEAAGNKQKAAALRMVVMMMTLGGEISPEARAFLLALPEKVYAEGKSVSSREKLATEAALGSGAIAEGALRLALAAGNNPSQLSVGELADLVVLLNDHGLTDLARGLALEGIQYQNPPR